MLFIGAIVPRSYPRTFDFVVPQLELLIALTCRVLMPTSLSHHVVDYLLLPFVHCHLHSFYTFLTLFYCLFIFIYW